VLTVPEDSVNPSSVDVAEMVMDPAPLVIETPVPAVRLATVYPVPLPIKRRPFAGTVDTPVPPSATAKSVIPEMLPPVIDTLLDAWVAIVPRPRLVRAVPASDAPVPPSATAKSVIPVMLPPVIDTLLDA